MSDYSVDKLNSLKKELIIVQQEILSERAQAHERIVEQKREVTEKFNAIVTYAGKYYKALDKKSQDHIKEVILFSRDTVKKSFLVIGININFNDYLFSLIKRDSGTGTSSSQVVHTTQTGNKLDGTDNKNKTEVKENKNLAMDQATFLRLAAQTISKNYAGDPLG